MANKFMIGLISLTAVFTLSACADKNQDETAKIQETNHSHMNHSSSSEVPEGLKI